MMSRRSFACLAGIALAVAVLFVAADPASAHYRRGRVYYPAYSGWYVPEYSAFGTDYYSFGVPSYYSEGMEGNFYRPFNGTSFGTYGAFSGAGADNNVLINVRVPPNATVW